MKTCRELLGSLQYECLQGTEDKEIDEVIYDSRKAKKDCLFICICGANSDGHDYAEEVIRKGAAVLIVEKEIALKEDILPADSDVTIIKVQSTRYAMACISAAYFDYPASKMKIIGITGTKGKTTTTYLMKAMLEQAGYKVGLIGTIEVLIAEKAIKADMTTPESYVLQQYFKEMADAHCDVVVMEVSSQALMLHRTQGFVFDVGIFTNISPDHIGPGEHDDFAHYLLCKSLLFKQCHIGFVNKDDEHYGQVIKGHTCKIKTYGLSDKADYYAQDMELLNEGGRLGVRFQVKGEVSFQAQIASPGRFSVYNALTAIAVCTYFGVSVDQIQAALMQARVKGRIELVPGTDEYSIIIDYAHNAMSLESLLNTLKEYHPKRLVCVFGCGGNRSKLRRYEMGEVSGTLSDLTIITSDNPRNEEPQDIINDIKTGIGRTKGAYVEICDRGEAIAYAVHHAQAGDVIVIAGKGHEDYQEIRGVKYPMDDRELVKKALEVLSFD